MWHNLKGILFDKDGTLFDHDATWVPWIVNVVQKIAPNAIQTQNELLRSAGYISDSKSFEAGGVFVAGTTDDLFEIWSELKPDLTLQELEEVGLLEAEKSPVVPVCDLAKILGQFQSAGLKLGVATNDYEQSAINQLKNAGVAQFFDVILGYDSGPTPKPAPDMVWEFCTRQNVEPKDIAMVGDSTHDLHAGRRANAKTIGVLTGPADAQSLAQADVVLPSIAAIPDLLNFPKS